MKKRMLSLCLVLLMLLSLTACGSKNTIPSANQSAETAEKQVELTMGSWRTDDVDEMNNLLAAYKKVAPNVTITFQPTNPTDYNATLRLQLESGTGPDLMYARSYATGAELFQAGYFYDCSDIPGLDENFSSDARAPWTADGKAFAVPFAAVSHAIYYNKDIFAAQNLKIPTTWDEFIDVCKALKGAGITPLANGLADEWDILECFFLGMLPNYIGGAAEREKYESGEKPMNSPEFVQAYTDIASVAPYLPEGFAAVTYNDSQALFNTGSAAMFMDGSWTAGVYKDVPFKWGLFALPARNSADTAICFHMDMAIAMNAATSHPEEAQAFLTWLCTQEGATIASQNLPLGYFPVINFPITLEDSHVNEFLQLNEGKTTDVRFVWPKLMDLYTPMNQAVISLLKGQITPQAAADMIEAEYKKQ
jgi:raffinose/stachyose/melibiose transport system substrate-binding protein